MILRFIGYLFGMGMLLGILVVGGVAWYISSISRDLPDFEVLNAYEPPVTTRIYANDGSLMSEYAHERRLYLPIQAIPEVVKNAFISAEDKNFFSHPGIDMAALARAIVTNVRNFGTDRRQVGASTITQQVAKNFLLSNERSIERKIKEAILSLRIEQAYSKNRILELYLNEIFLGLGSYGVAGAALTYFDKSVNELNLQEAAYLAALPKAPNNYHPFNRTEAAIERRNWVIDRMIENGHISLEEGEAAKKVPLGVNPRRRTNYLFASEYFSEEVRREIVSRYGEDALYEGGLSIRTTLDPALQVMARRALQNGLLAYDEEQGWRGPVDRIDASGDWGAALGKMPALADVPEWRLAAVLEVGDDGARIGLQPRTEVSGELSGDREEGRISFDNMKWAAKVRIKGESARTAKTPAEIVEVGDVVYVTAMGDDQPDEYRLRQLPAIEGAIIAMDPHTGRVLAMAGGFTFAGSQFNRATQAYRQPGSSFKPFVYAAALDNGYTPSSVVLDAPLRIEQAGSGIWEPKNYGGGYAGPSTLRVGIEKSRNLMTVRLAKDMGMPLVVEYSRRFGIYDNLSPFLSMSLGSGETTVLRMVSAYAVLANGGRKIVPSFIDRIQDRYGKTIYRHDERICDACSVANWEGQDEPVLDDTRDQVLDPMTAYQMTSMLEGVVQHGTATIVSKLGVPVAGKTGTTNDEKDAWFVGYTPDLVAGVYMGFDNPRPMGRGSTGGQLAAPIFLEFMQAALAGKPPVDFRVPKGIKLIPIDRKTGLQAQPGDEGVILEAFKPGTAPPDVYSVIGFADDIVRDRLTVSPDANRAVLSGTGGLY
ncbi:MAG: penicillin-binding protein 1A [Alphaproteobacteria bacterium]|nr:MAG: penicillin-binding protein 1A [Alphaproteobacteria bacterium]